MLSLLFFSSGQLRAVAIYPLSAVTKGRDTGVFGNPPGILLNVRPAPGPDLRPGTATQFFGQPNSYIQFPNNGRLDTKRSITLLAWIKHEGKSGPIFNYNPNGWGVHLWMTGRSTLFVRFNRRGSASFTPPLSSNRVQPKRWRYVGATYDWKSGVAKLYVDSKVVASKQIGRGIALATNYPARMGARVGDGRYFKGRISCLQVYSEPLTSSQIASRKDRCFTKGKRFR